MCNKWLLIVKINRYPANVENMVSF